LGLQSRSKEAVILVDTSVLSFAYRRTDRGGRSPFATQFATLVEKGSPIVVPGIVLQEILSGVREEVQFNRLRAAVEVFPIALASRGDHLTAAKVRNLLSRRGVTAASVDVLIAAMAIRRNADLFTLDGDLESFAEFLPLRLFKPI
jgi:predicted nucleic acid-binding protein